jgi:uncharacterized membrane protein HdeD (DUF308 family)
VKLSLRIVGAIILVIGCTLIAYAIYRTLAAQQYGSEIGNIDLTYIVGLVMFIIGYWFVVRKKSPEKKTG